uniref:Uncharacterized protein n=1 Tax=Strigamia maritima TaxID=126957 RepID=T1JGH0_STRMM
MLGVMALESPKHPSAGRKSSTTMKRTFFGFESTPTVSSNATPMTFYIMTHFNENSGDINVDINVDIAPDETETDEGRKCLFENTPPNYTSIMETECEDALVEKLEKQYGPYGFCDYIKAGMIFLIGSAGPLLLIIFFTGGPPSMIVMGSMYLNSCPLQPYIPIYLLVGGIFSTLSIIFVITIRLRFRRKDDQTFRRCDVTLLGISNFIHCFTISWFVAGCTWVYGIYEPSYDTAQLYCDKIVYLFSFWLLNSIFIAMGALLIFGLFILYKLPLKRGSSETPKPHPFLRSRYGFQKSSNLQICHDNQLSSYLLINT